jgi:hypothetical protein
MAASVGSTKSGHLCRASSQEAEHRIIFGWILNNHRGKQGHYDSTFVGVRGSGMHVVCDSTSKSSTAKHATANPD